jgi:hypothetical protein
VANTSIAKSATANVANSGPGAFTARIATLESARTSKIVPITPVSIALGAFNAAVSTKNAIGIKINITSGRHMIWKIWSRSPLRDNVLSLSLVFLFADEILISQRSQFSKYNFNVFCWRLISG